MPDGDAEQLGDASDSPTPTAPLRDLPSASAELARQELSPVPVYGLSDAHTQRLHEATVRVREIQAKQADDDRDLRKTIASRVFWAITVQVGIADVAFLTYGFWNGWNVPGSTIVAWLSATVVQVIALALVITRSLFPPALPKIDGAAPTPGGPDS